MGRLVLLFCLLCCLFSVLSPASVRAADSLEGYWKFDETNAGTFSDSSGNGNTGTGQGGSGDNNTPQPSTDIDTGFPYTNTGSLDFDGTDDEVLVGSTLGLSTGSFTIAGWVNLDSTSESGAFVKVGNNTAGFGVGVGSTIFDDNGNDLILLYEGIRWIDTNQAIGTGWRHIAMVVDAAGQPEAFIDGTSVYSDTGSAPAAPSGNEAYIGGYTSSLSASRHVDALIDDVRIYSRVLSDTEISRLADKDTPAIAYDTSTFSESTDNDGSISTTVNITLTNDTFTQSSGTFTGGGTHYTANNVPAGLSVQITAASSTTATLTLTGNATAHADADDISNLEMVWADGAFTTFNSASITNSTKNDFSIDFHNAPTLTAFASTIDTAYKNTEVEITLADLKAQGNEADSDGTVDAFVVDGTNLVQNGSFEEGTPNPSNYYTSEMGRSYRQSPIARNFSSFGVSNWTQTGYFEWMAGPSSYGSDGTAAVGGYDNAGTALLYQDGISLTAGTTYTFSIDLWQSGSASGPSLDVRLTTGDASDFAAPENTITLVTNETTAGTDNQVETVSIEFTPTVTDSSYAIQIQGTAYYGVYMLLDNVILKKKSVSNGTLKIGSSSAAATAWADGTNNTIDSSNNAYWTPPTDTTGTLDAFTVVAQDDDSLESTPAIQTQISVIDPYITYSTSTFTENSHNHGSIDTAINITLTDDTFTRSSGNFTNGTHYTTSNVPAGLSTQITATSSTAATLTLTGNATSHKNADDISDLTITWENDAFTTDNASQINNYSKSDFAVDFAANTISGTNTGFDGNISGTNSLTGNLTSMSTVIARDTKANLTAQESVFDGSPLVSAASSNEVYSVAGKQIEHAHSTTQESIIHVLQDRSTDENKKYMIVIPSGITMNSISDLGHLQTITLPTISGVDLKYAVNMPSSSDPTAVTFDGAIDVCLPGTTSSLETSDASDVLVYFSNDGSTWAVDSAASDKQFTGEGQFCFQTTHLTSFAIGVESEDETKEIDVKIKGEVKLADGLTAKVKQKIDEIEISGDYDKDHISFDLEDIGTRKREGFVKIKIKDLDLPDDVDVISHDNDETVAKIEIKSEHRITSFLKNLINKEEDDDGEEEATSDSEKVFPLHLFDISLKIDDATIDDIRDLSAKVFFTSFGTEPTPVDLTFTVLDEAGLELYRDEGAKDDVIVETEKVFHKNFSEAPELPSGKYELVLKTSYGENVEDTFKQSFSIEKKQSLLRRIYSGAKSLISKIIANTKNVGEFIAQKSKDGEGAKNLITLFSKHSEKNPRLPEDLKDHRYETVAITLALSDGTPLEGARLTLFSEPKKAVTDEQGVAVFEDVEAGKHKLKIAHGKSKGEQELFFEEKAQNISITINPVLVDGISPWTTLVLTIFAALVTGVIVWHWKNRN